MKKTEIIEELLTMGCDKEEISGLNTVELKKMLEEEKQGKESLIILDEITQSMEEPVKTDPPIDCESSLINPPNMPDYNTQNNIPEPSDPGWTQYVLSLFQDDEMDGEHPRLEGLRRIAERLLGEVMQERCELVSSPTMENGERACAKAVIMFSNGKVFEALADACPSNCTKDFAIYPVAMADTRAKGRAYRAALKLKRVVSAEEIGITSENDEDVNRNINVGQQTAIRLLAERLNISIKNLLSDLEISSIIKNDIVDLASLKYSEALVILSRLNDLRQNGHIPEKLRRNNGN